MAWKDPKGEKARAYYRERSRLYREANREKVNQYTRNWRKAHPDRQKKACDRWKAENPEKLQAYMDRTKRYRTLSARARKYGMTVGELLAFMAARNGVCEACGGVGEHIDHEHATGAVRGLLCARCNHVLGHSKEDIDRLIGVAAYLERSLSEKVLAAALRKGLSVYKALDRRVA